MTDTFPTTWFLEDRYLGAGESSPLIRWGTPLRPLSRAYFCPRCGTVWARIEVKDARWNFIPRRCKKHGPPFLLLYHDHTLNDSAPIRVWAREFIIAMDLYLKYNREYDLYLCTEGI